MSRFGFLLSLLLLCVNDIFSQESSNSSLFEDYDIPENLFTNENVNDEDLWNLLTQLTRNKTDDVDAFPGFTEYDEIATEATIFETSSPISGNDLEKTSIKPTSLSTEKSFFPSGRDEVTTFSSSTENATETLTVTTPSSSTFSPYVSQSKTGIFASESSTTPTSVFDSVTMSKSTQTTPVPTSSSSVKEIDTTLTESSTTPQITTTSKEKIAGTSTIDSTSDVGTSATAKASISGGFISTIPSIIVTSKPTVSWENSTTSEAATITEEATTLIKATRASTESTTSEVTMATAASVVLTTSSIVSSPKSKELEITSPSTTTGNVKIVSPPPSMTTSGVEKTNTQPSMTTSEVRMSSMPPTITSTKMEISQTTPSTTNSKIKIPSTTTSIVEILSTTTSISSTTPRTTTSKTKIASTSPVTTTIKVKMSSTTPRTTTSKTKFTSPMTGTTIRKAEVISTTPPAMTSNKAKITSTMPSTSTRKTDITSTTPSTTTSNAKITSTTPSMTASKVKISSTTPSTTTRKADITSTTASTTISNAKITSTTPSTTASKAKITSTTLSMTTKKADITSTTPSTTTSKAKITSTTPSMTISKAKITSTTPSTTTSKAKITSTTPKAAVVATTSKTTSKSKTEITEKPLSKSTRSSTSPKSTAFTRLPLSITTISPSPITTRKTKTILSPDKVFVFDSLDEDKYDLITTSTSKLDLDLRKKFVIKENDSERPPKPPCVPVPIQPPTVNIFDETKIFMIDEVSERPVTLKKDNETSDVKSTKKKLIDEKKNKIDLKPKISVLQPSKKDFHDEHMFDPHKVFTIPETKNDRKKNTPENANKLDIFSIKPSKTSTVVNKIYPGFLHAGEKVDKKHKMLDPHKVFTIPEEKSDRRIAKNNSLGSSNVKETPVYTSPIWHYIKETYGNETSFQNPIPPIAEYGKTARKDHKLPDQIPFIPIPIAEHGRTAMKDNKLPEQIPIIPIPIAEHGRTAMKDNKLPEQIPFIPIRVPELGKNPGISPIPHFVCRNIVRNGEFFLDCVPASKSEVKIIPVHVSVQTEELSPRVNPYFVSHQTGYPSEVPDPSPGMFYSRKSGAQFFQVNSKQPPEGATSLGYDPYHSGTIQRRSRRSPTGGVCGSMETGDETGLTLTFVFDNTGSMHQELQQMKDTAKEITTQVTGLKKNLIHDYVLVTFNDPRVEEPYCTTDYTAFLDRLDMISVSGGGDCEEMCLTGLERALTASRPNSVVFVITDADAKDYHREEEIMRLIMRKTPFIFYLMTDRCSDSWTPGFQVYENITSVSGGQRIDMEKSSVKAILEVFINVTAIQENVITLAKVSSPMAAPTPYDVPISVDQSVSQLTISVAGQKPQLRVTDPEGANPPGEEKANLPTIKLILFKDPIPGVWTASVGSSSAHSVSSTGVSETSFKYGFSVVPTLNINETTYRPLKSAHNYLLLDPTNPGALYNLTQILIVGLHGTVLDTIFLDKIPFEDGHIYRSRHFVPPNELFNLIIEGVAEDGSPIRRVSSSAIAPQLPELPFITLKTRAVVEAGDTFTINCKVESLVPIMVKIFLKSPSKIAVQETFEQTGTIQRKLVNISPDDAGIYVCWAKNVAGSEYKEIEIIVKVTPPEVKMVAEAAFAVGNTLEVFCHIRSPVNYTVTWTRGLDGVSVHLFNSSRVRLYPDRLTVLRALSSDQGWYQCKAANIGGEGTAKVYVKQSVLPSLDTSVESLKFQNNERISVTCSSQGGTPSPKLYWHKNEKLYKGDNVRSIVSELSEDEIKKKLIVYIKKAVKEDEGTYICFGENMAGNVSKSVELIYTELPVLKAVQRSHIIRPGDQIRLKCTISGVPFPNIIWKKNSTPVTTEDSYFYMTDDNSLYIPSASLAHTGLYSCFGQNEVGTAQDYISVNVSGLPPSILEPPQDTTIEIGKNGSLTCIADGLPYPKISWMKFFEGDFDDWSKAQHLDSDDFNVLHISGSSMSDEGIYVCLVQNALGNSSAAARVTVTGAVLPKIYKISGEVEIIKSLVGDRVELPCLVVAANPAPEVFWWRDSLPLSVIHPQTINMVNALYTISSMSLADVGIYICEARNEIGSDRKRLHLMLYEPPSMDTSVSPNVRAIVGSWARLPCQVRGDPVPSVSWSRQSFKNRTLRGITMKDSNDLYFENVTEEDTGRYVCRAENIAGIAKRPVALHVIVPPKMSSWPEETLVEKGNIVTLECRVRGVPRPVLTWLKDNHTLTKQKPYGQFLRFYANSSDSGTYSCTAENKAGTASIKTNLLVLVPPQIENTTSLVKAVAGSEAILPCLVSGNPQPSVTWHINGELIKKEIGSESGTLKVENVTEVDAGTYTCIGQNKAGTNRKKIELIILTPPRVVPWEGPLKVVPGELVNLTCRYFGEPQPSIRWLKDKLPLNPQFTLTGDQLIFTANKQHKGSFSCEATNEAGSDTKDLFLIILDPPSFASHLPITVETIEGKGAELPCVAYGDPEPEISWSRSELPIKNDTRMVIEVESGSLRVVSAALADEGYYTCTASNRAGVSARIVELLVLEPPKVNVSISSQLVKEGEAVLIVCTARGRPSPKILWKHNGNTTPDNSHQLRFTASSAESGSYSCFARSPAGEDSGTVHLNVSVLPTIKGVPVEGRITVVEGGNLSLECEADGIPLPVVTWYFNDTQLPLEGNPDRFRIKDISTKESGIYKCEVTNFAGTVRRMFTIDVNVRPQILDDLNRNIIVKAGTDVVIPCSAVGTPTPRISWKFGYKEVPIGSPLDDAALVYNSTLIMFNANINMTGNYTCFATNVEGSMSREYILNVEDEKPKLDESVTLVEIMESENGALRCDSAPPGSKIIWLKENKTLDRLPLERADDVHFLEEDGGRVLKITEAFTQDTGRYTCLYSSAEDPQNQTQELAVQVLARPYFLDDYYQTERTVLQNKSLTLHCPATGSPNPMIVWRLAESNLPINMYTVKDVEVRGEQDEELFFRSAKSHHTGLYSCSAVNRLGRDTRTFNVKVEGAPERFGAELSDVEMAVDKPLLLDCCIEGSPLPNFTWTHTPLSRVKRLLKYISKTIFIGNIQTEDEGIYQCFASNNVGNATKRFNVSVIEMPRLKRGVAAVGEVVLSEGEELELSCEYEGLRPVLAAWSFNGTEVSPSPEVDIQLRGGEETTVFLLKRGEVNKSHEGDYTCSISNLAGSAHHAFQVRIVAAPRFSNENWKTVQKIHLMVGSPLTIDCPVEGEDEFKIEWKKDNVVIQFEDNRRLSLPEAQVSTEGHYSCVASNQAGRVSSKYQIIVLDPPKFVNVSESYQRVYLDSKLQLLCTVSGNPKPSILWTKDLVSINEETFPQVIISNHNQTLEIDDTAVSDGGKYSCFPSNVAGSLENHFDVEVVEAPYPVGGGDNASLSRRLTVDLFRRAVLRCRLEGTPEPNITWYRGNEEIEENSNSVYRISLDRKTLTVSHTSEATAGLYRCIGQNEHGHNEYNFVLKARVEMQWGPWTGWTECSKSCQEGEQSRRRDCLGGEIAKINREYVEMDNTSCVGPLAEVRPCNIHICPVSGGWSGWSSWGPCSGSCDTGVRRRSRRCNNPPPAHGGPDCSGDTVEEQACSLQPCPLNGNWDSWSEWGACSVSCGTGVQMRMRMCNNPRPAYGGLPCQGPSRDIDICRKPKCKLDLESWSSWSRWGECTTSCGNGVQIRTRICPAEKLGRFCSGQSSQTKHCRKAACESRRYPRHAELSILGEVNGEPVNERIRAEIRERDSQTEITAVSDNLTNTGLGPYLPLMVTPVSWFSAYEEDMARNGESLTGGHFHQHSNITFGNGDKMRVEGEAGVSDSKDILKVNLQVNGQTPSLEPAATVLISPITEDILQMDPNSIIAKSNSSLDINGKYIPFLVDRKVTFRGNKRKQIYPVETMHMKPSKMKYNQNNNILEFRAASSITSKQRDSLCPPGFKLDKETEHCIDINECKSRRLNICHQTQICINTLGSYRCECRQGFRKIPGKPWCRDMDECKEGLDQCSHKCINTRGGYQCHCPSRLILSEDMHTCVEVMEDDYSDSSVYPDTDLETSRRFEGVDNLQVNSRTGKERPFFNGNYDFFEMDDQKADESWKFDTVLPIPNATVLRRPLSCNKGFRPGRTNCEDINECLEQEKVCLGEELCLNLPGSFECIDAPCPDAFFLSPETKTCLLLCQEEDSQCTDGAQVSEGLQIVSIPVYNQNNTFFPFEEIAELTSYDHNQLALTATVYQIYINDAGIPVRVRTERVLGVLYATKYFVVNNTDKLVVMGTNYDSEGTKLHSTMFVIILYNVDFMPLPHDSTLHL